MTLAKTGTPGLCELLTNLSKIGVGAGDGDRNPVNFPLSARNVGNLCGVTCQSAPANPRPPLLPARRTLQGTDVPLVVLVVAPDRQRNKGRSEGNPRPSGSVQIFRNVRARVKQARAIK